MKEKIKDVLIFVIFLILSGLIIFVRDMNNMDEIWNYNFGLCVSNGLVPYRDFNIIQMPLLPWIMGISFTIFGKELFIMRILAIFEISFIFLFIYKIMKSLEINESLNIIITFGLFWYARDYLCLDYNFFALLITLVIIYLELICSNKSYKYHFGLGVLGVCCFLCKQTIGLFVCLSMIIYELIFLFFFKERSFKDICFRVLGMLIPGILFTIYLVLTKSFYDFWDYAVLGINTFSNKISYSHLLNNEDISIKVLSIFIPLSFIFSFIFCIWKKDKKLVIILFLELSMFSLVYPISDDAHLIIGMITSFVGLGYLINKILKMKIFESKKALYFKYFFEYLSYLFIILLIWNFSDVFCKEFKEIERFSELKHFKYIPTTVFKDEYINTFDEVILNSDKNVYILNFDAAIYMIPIDKYNKNYDMFLLGNLGGKGEEGQIENIKNEDAYYLITNDDMHRNWQNPENVREYIKNNMNYVSEVWGYWAYEN